MSFEDSKEKFEWRKLAFEYVQKTHGIENQNDMIGIHENKVNKISEWNLLHDIINPPKITKKIRYILISYYTWMYYYPKG